MYVQHLCYQRENVMQFRGNSSDQAAAFRVNLLASQGAQKKMNYHNFKKLFQKRGEKTRQMIEMEKRHASNWLETRHFSCNTSAKL